MGIGDIRGNILGMLVNSITLSDATNVIISWAKVNQSSYVCVSNVHMCMESYDDESFRSVVNSADLTVPDGMPLHFGLKQMGYSSGEQIRGADLTRALLDQSQKNDLVVAFYGGTEQSISQITHLLEDMYPNVKVGVVISPPFRDLSEQEDQYYVDLINASRTQLLFVGLGCPKQERWMNAHKGKINAVMVGVGAVFDFLSGTKAEAPKLIQQLGLEWFFRFITEPKRLWKRYLKHNPRFVWMFSKQLLTNKVGGR